MTDASAAPAAAAADGLWTCPFCPLACDHLGVEAEPSGAALRLVGGHCPTARAALATFPARPVPASPSVDGVACDLGTAVAAAARLLSSSRQPLFGGLGTDVAGARALYPLACATGAVVDAGGPGLFAGLRALQDRGQYTTTFAEVRTRADVVVFVGGLPDDVAPLIAERCGLFDPQGSPRRVVLLDAPEADARRLVEAARSAGRAALVVAGAALDAGVALDADAARDAGHALNVGAALDANAATDASAAIHAGPPVAAASSADSTDAGDAATSVGLVVERVASGLDLFDTLALLGALVAGRAMPAAPAPLRALAGRLGAARYAVFVGAPARLPADAVLLIEAVHRVVATLNRATRAAALWVGGGNGAATVNQVQTWLSGLPLRSRAGPRGLEHEPALYDGARLVAEGAVDALLWVASFDAAAAPPPLSLPTVVLGHPALATASASRAAGTPAVFIPVATPGIGSDGHLFRTDGTVLMPLHAVCRDTLPTVADVARRLDAAVRGSRDASVGAATFAEARSRWEASSDETAEVEASTAATWSGPLPHEATSP